MAQNTTTFRQPSFSSLDQSSAPNMTLLCSRRRRLKISALTILRRLDMRHTEDSLRAMNNSRLLWSVCGCSAWRLGSFQQRGSY